MKQKTFKNKKRMYPRATARLPLFMKVLSSEVKNGKVEIIEGEGLTQTHRDILEAIAMIGKRATYKGDRMCFAFTPYEVLKELGHSKITNHKWFLQKLREIYNVNIRLIYEDKVRKFFLEGHILDMFGYSRVKRKKKNSAVYGDMYFAVVFSEIFTELMKKDIIIWANPDVTKKVIQLKYDFVKAVARFCFTHEQVNMKFDDLLKNMGIHDKIADVTKRKLRQQLQKSQNELREIGITITKKDGEVYVFYKKDLNCIAFDYQNEKQEKPIKVDKLLRVDNYFLS